MNADLLMLQAQSQSAKNQMAFQERMSNTAHQREVADLKAAGLNPVLSSGGSGASTPNGAAGDLTGFDISKAIGALSSGARGSAKVAGNTVKEFGKAVKDITKVADKAVTAMSNDVLNKFSLLRGANNITNDPIVSSHLFEQVIPSASRPTWDKYNPEGSTYSERTGINNSLFNTGFYDQLHDLAVNSSGKLNFSMRGKGGNTVLSIPLGELLTALLSGSERSALLFNNLAGRAQYGLSTIPDYINQTHRSSESTRSNNWTSVR